MIDAISRSALVNDMKGVVFREKPFGDADVDRLYQSIKDMYSGMIYLVETAPALDVVPVVHARWIYTGEMDEDGNCEANCSHCGAGDKHRADLKDAVPYCWKCGARMDGEADG